MMNKEKFIDKIIERHKERKSKYTPSLYDCCQEIDCADCPFYQERHGCRDAVIDELITRLIGGEEYQETNFDHYIKNYFLVAYDNEVTFKLEDGWKENFCNSGTDLFREWLLLPYKEPPKPKYKLSQFEYDLLKCYNLTELGIDYFWVSERMHDKGYFKDIPTDVPIGDILDNCEVVEE